MVFILNNMFSTIMSYKNLDLVLSTEIQKPHQTFLSSEVNYHIATSTSINLTHLLHRLAYDWRMA